MNTFIFKERLFNDKLAYEKVYKRVELHAKKVDEWCETRGYVRVWTNVIGSYNYNLQEESSDVDTRSIVVPLLTTEMYSQFDATSLHLDDDSNEILHIMDARYAVQAYKKQCITALEDLDAVLVGVNPDFILWYKNFIQDIKEKLTYYKPYRFLTSQLGYIQSMINRNDVSGKNLMHAERARLILYKYSCYRPLAELLDMSSSRETLLQLKHLSSEKINDLVIEWKNWMAQRPFDNFPSLLVYKLDTETKVDTELINWLVSLYKIVWSK